MSVRITRFLCQKFVKSLSLRKIVNSFEPLMQVSQVGGGSKTKTGLISTKLSLSPKIVMKCYDGTGNCATEDGNRKINHNLIQLKKAIDLIGHNNDLERVIKKMVFLSRSEIEPETSVPQSYCHTHPATDTGSS